MPRSARRFSKRGIGGCQHSAAPNPLVSKSEFPSGQEAAMLIGNGGCMQINTLRLSAAGLMAIVVGLAQAQAPTMPAFDPAKMRAELEAFNKKPDTPGTGKYPALKEMTESLPNHVIYRPANLNLLGKDKLGVVVWGNGGCAADGAGARFHLAEIASHGYLAIASGTIQSGPGAPPRPDGATLPATQSALLTEAIDWALAENQRRDSPYYGRINPRWIAVSGWSCGGLQALEVAADPRVRTAVIHSSGIFTDNTPIPGITITKAALQKLHAPIIYILGGPGDIAYPNGMDDFKRIDSVPVFVANLDVGHGGTFLEANGGREASVAVSWLDWQLKGDNVAARRFVGTDCGLCKDPTWKVDSKHLSKVVAAPVSVHIRAGELTGDSLPGGGGVFKGIPYAAPPTGTGRWTSPQSVAPWRGARAATAFGAACEQPAQGWNDSVLASMDEDCLYLNVWTPSLHPKERLPVMVWIHGGAFVGGAGTDPIFAGDAIVRHGVILVTLNYRLGIFGFYAHPQLTRDSLHHSSGNFGLEDQLAALQWVHDNIAEFGGDAGRVTVFGQSAGGMSIVSLMASRLEANTFQRAIVESGVMLGGPPQQRLKDAEAVGTEFAGDSSLQALRAVSATDLLKRFGSFMATHRDTRLGPTIDGYVLTEDPGEIFRRHLERKVALIIGNNAREGFGRLSEDALPDAIRQFYGANASAALPLYATPNPLLGPPAAQWLTDSSFRCSAVATAARHDADGSPVYSYQFEQSLPGREVDGAAHSYELPYVFGNLLASGPLAGPFSEPDRRLSSVMLSFWTNFAKNGDPNGTGLPSWPRYGGSAGHYMRFASVLPENAQAADGLRRPQCDLFAAKLASTRSP
jgi:para-nitrobenzyl esterase